MAQVYRLNGISDAQVANLRTLAGDRKSYLNPIKDNNGNWVISVEEFNAIEFGKYRDNVLKNVTLIEYVPIPWTKETPT